MTIRELGATGLQVSRIGLGLAALGRPAYITLGRGDDLGPDRSVEALERRCHAMLDTAYAAGIRYLDAARSYGLAERFLASWLDKTRFASHPPTIGSKWGYTYTGAWQLDAPIHEVKDLSLETLRRQCAESGALLGRRLSLYQIHSATLESGVLDDPAVLAELVRLRASGLAIGLTVTGPEQASTIRHAFRVTADGVNPFQVVQATWNVLEPSAGAALAEASARGWGVIVKEVLANGRLTDAHAGAGLSPLRREAAARRITLDALCVAAALSQSWADVVLSGAVNTEQLHSHLSALDVSVVTSTATAEEPSRYWSHRSSMSWS